MNAKHLLHMLMDREGYILWKLTCEDPTRSTCKELGNEGACFLIPWFEEIGGEMIGDSDWPEDPHFPLPVRWEGPSDEPVIVFDAAAAEPEGPQ